MAVNGQALSDSEMELADFGFLHAIGGIYQKLDDAEKESFENMLRKAFKSDAPQILEDSVRMVSNPGGCPEDCSFVRGMGCVCP